MASNPLADSFIDSNIWLYALFTAGDPVKRTVAAQLISSTSSITSTQVINEVCYQLLRQAKWDETQLANLINSFYTNTSVVQLDLSLLLDGSRLRASYSLSLWDSLIIAAALSANARNLYSEDMQHGLVIDQKLTIINPFLP